MTCSFYILTILNIEKCFDLQLIMDINQKEFIDDMSYKVSSAKRLVHTLFYLIRSTKGLKHWSSELREVAWILLE
jgi:hypothetical protein